MCISYPEAVNELRLAADAVRTHIDSPWPSEMVLTPDAVGRVATSDVKSPVCTPEHDTSAMDGYALMSSVTAQASPEAPVLLKICGTIAAGDDAFCVSDVTPEADLSKLCFEIMTGGIFPTSSEDTLDACVKVEDVFVVIGADQHRYIRVTKPIAPNCNRRLAGEDIQHGAVLLRAGEIIRLSHIMPLISVGVEALAVAQKARAAIWSTGKELVRGVGTRDINGPFLKAASRELGLQPSFLGVLNDKPQILAEAIKTTLHSDNYDVLITSGGVSAGKFDFIRETLDSMGASVFFHGVDIRPGHPVLFALLKSGAKLVPFFGLPGNPGAAAACFQFLVVPYVQHLLRADIKRPVRARLSSKDNQGLVTQAYDRFRPGRLNLTGECSTVYDLGQGSGPAKMSPYVTADCWIHIKRDGKPGDLVDCYSM